MTSFRTTTPRARDAHTCGDCHRRIDPGEFYVRVKIFLTREVFTWKSCVHCQAVLKLYEIPEKVDAEGNREQGYPDFRRWANRPYDTAPMHERFARDGWKHGWRGEEGFLWPVPDGRNTL